MRKGGIGKKALLSVTFMAMVMGAATLAYALSGYWSSFVSTYSTTGRIPSTSPLLASRCLLCHTGYPTSSPSINTLNNYGNDYANSGYDFAAVETLDSDGDGYTNIAEILAGTYPGDAASRPAAADTTPPVVTAFVVPSTAASLTVPVTTLTATDNVGVTGYLVTETSTAPPASAAGWTVAAPTTYTFASAGPKILYAWAKDAAGHVSTALNAATTITLTDTTAPVVATFTIPATSDSLVVPITALTATDSVGVAGYLVTETSTAPSPAPALGWIATAPATYTFASQGAKTLYAWAKDAAGNVSTSRSAPTVISLTDTAAPVLTAFVVPPTSVSLTVPITTMTATDNVGVAGYLVTETPTAPSPAPALGWTATAPATYTFASQGANTLYAWAKDAAGNVSQPLSTTTTIGQADQPIATTGVTVPPDPTAGNGGGGGCFIATAAFGSRLNPYVKILRAFRDTYLMTNRAGQTFVTWYYHTSPPLAGVIAHSGILRSVVRLGLLPLIAFSALSLTVGFVPGLICLVLVLAIIWLASRKIYLRIQASSE